MTLALRIAIVLAVVGFAAAHVWAVIGDESLDADVRPLLSAERSVDDADNLYLALIGAAPPAAESPLHAAGRARLESGLATVRAEQPLPPPPRLDVDFRVRAPGESGCSLSKALVDEACGLKGTLVDALWQRNAVAIRVFREIVGYTDYQAPSPMHPGVDAGLAHDLGNASVVDTLQALENGTAADAWTRALAAARTWRLAFEGGCDPECAVGRAERLATALHLLARVAAAHAVPDEQRSALGKALEPIDAAGLGRRMLQARLGRLDALRDTMTPPGPPTFVAAGAEPEPVDPSFLERTLWRLALKPDATMNGLLAAWPAAGATPSRTCPLFPRLDDVGGALWNSRGRQQVADDTRLAGLVLLQAARIDEQLQLIATAHALDGQAVAASSAAGKRLAQAVADRYRGALPERDADGAWAFGLETDCAVVLTGPRALAVAVVGRY